MVLSALLSSQYLLKAIREKGGAYGAGAMQDNQTGTFKFFSYRDPRLVETLVDFDESLTWLKNTAITEDMLEQAKLSMISAIDMPLSPSQEPKITFEQDLVGLNVDIREAVRKQILTCSVQDVLDVAIKYLKLEKAHIAVITNLQNAEVLDAPIFEI
jgi:Zn-dependent M16 (insulinase) family peptidase